MLSRVSPHLFRNSCNLLNQGVSSFPTYLAASFHTSALLDASKADLAALRKKTGYSFSICKKALTETNDLASAEKWLKEQAQAQGWAKAQKLQGRNTSQGLLGVKVSGNTAALIELRCETDFVAKNDKFIRILDSIATSCLKVPPPPQSSDSLSNIQLKSSEVGSLTSDEDGSTLGDLVALNIGKIGENISIGDATVIHTKDGVNLIGLAHPNTNPPQDKLNYGRFVAVMAYTSSGSGGKNLASQICQHIIGMAPTCLNDETDKENSLLHQAFLLDEDKTVGEVANFAGFNIISFARREVGRQD